MRLDRILLLLTAVTGVVDAVSFLAFQHVFTANMTGNIVFLGFALAGAPGLSVLHSLVSLIAFLAGALIGGRVAAGKAPDASKWAAYAFSLEAFLLFVAMLASVGLTRQSDGNGTQFLAVIALTALAMGVRNACVRKLAVPDLTTTVLTMAITGLVADSAVAGGSNPHWRRRAAAVLSLLGGAIAGAFLLKQSVTLPLGVCVAATITCAFFAGRLDSDKVR